MDILPLLTLLLQAKGGAGAPPQGEAALARLVSALNAPPRAASRPRRKNEAHGRPRRKDGARPPIRTPSRGCSPCCKRKRRPHNLRRRPPLPTRPRGRKPHQNPQQLLGRLQKRKTHQNPQRAAVQATARAQEREESLAPVRRIRGRGDLAPARRRPLCSKLRSLNSELCTRPAPARRPRAARTRRKRRRAPRGDCRGAPVREFFFRKKISFLPRAGGEQGGEARGRRTRRKIWRRAKGWRPSRGGDARAVGCTRRWANRCGRWSAWPPRR